MKTLLGLAVLNLSLQAMAQVHPEAQAQTRPPKVLIFGEGEEILGQDTVPEGEIFPVPSTVKHTSLIRIRKDFKDRAMQSIAER